MKLRWIDSAGAGERDLAELEALRTRNDGFLWLDIFQWSQEAETILTEKFHFHPTTSCVSGPCVHRRARA